MRLRDVAALVLPLAWTAGCTRGCGGSDRATTSPPGAVAPLPTAAASASAGAPCKPGPDSQTCTPDGLEAVTCAGGTWRTLEACRGPNHCQGAGARLACDVGELQPGDACVAGRVSRRCQDARNLLDCKAGRWAATPCGPRQTCGPPPGPGDAAGPPGEIGGQVGCNLADGRL